MTQLRPNPANQPLSARRPFTANAPMAPAWKSCLIAILALFSFVAPAVSSKSAPQPPVPGYKVVDLGPVVFDLSSNLSRYICINNEGEIAANWMPSDMYMHGYVWKNGHRKDIGTLPGYLDSRVLAINDQGNVVGYCESPDRPGVQRAFVWSNDKMRPLNLPKGDGQVAAVGINDKDEILMRTTTDAYILRNGKLARLGVEGAAGLNDKGVVIGTGRYHPGAGVGYAYVLDSKRPLDLGTLPGGWRSTAQGINNSGQVVGYCGVHFRSRAFLWNGRLVDLGTEANSDDSVATSINGLGQIVGYAGGPGVYGTYSRAYIWQNGIGYNLNDHIASNSGWVLISADCINDRGEIVGFGHHNGADRAFLLIPNR